MFKFLCLYTFSYTSHVVSSKDVRTTAHTHPSINIDEFVSYTYFLSFFFFKCKKVYAETYKPSLTSLLKFSYVVDLPTASEGHFTFTNCVALAILMQLK